jgi:hypothetical protein
MSARVPATLALALLLSGVAPAAEIPGQYVGPAACSSNNCHGSVAPRTDSATSLQNEYVTWYKSDRHAKAYASLLTDRGLRIGRLLGMADASAEPATWIERGSHPERCLECHTLDRPGLKHEDGVSCEACHGPAGGWLTKHTERGWEPAQSLPLGMLETEDPATAAATCLGCHLGTSTARVDHELLAAGHPTLAFELDTFSANIVHWKEHDGNRRWYRGGAWGFGQVASAREAARFLALQVRGQGWPDFSVYECSACHHDLRQPSWRQQRGYGGRKPGTPPFDASRGALLPLLAAALKPGDAGTFGPAVVRFTATSNADGVIDTTARLLGDSPGLDDARGVRLLRGIVDAADPLAYGGFRTAQQAAWALDALAVARGETARDPLRQAIGRLFDELKDPGAYDPARFVRAVRALGPVLP